MKSRNSHHCRRGFTLVELSVVVLLVIVLTAFGFQLLKISRKRAHLSTSIVHLQQLATANLVYASDHLTYCPAADPGNLKRWHGSRVSTAARFDPRTGFLSPYLGESQSVSSCPEFQDHLKGSSSWEDGSGGYGYNFAYIGGQPHDTFKPNRPSNVTNPVRTLMFATTAIAKSGGLQEYPFADPPSRVDANGRTREALQPTVHFRFEGRALVAWCDGHVSTELPTGKSTTNFYGGDNDAYQMGFCGPRANNGWWNPRN